MVKALVCGGRDYKNADHLWKVMDAAVERLGVTEIVHDGSRPGVAFLAWQWADQHKVPVALTGDDWRARAPDLIIAFAGADDALLQAATDAGIKVQRI